ncbi:MAG: IS110 family transposase [Planctomycetota bacterium]|nr:IS110 family transposase [Planctomycetota bacterium]
MKDTTIGVDLAKSVFEIGISTHPGAVSEHRRVSRKRFIEFMHAQKPATFVMEACGSSHYWGRELEKCGHRVVVLPPMQVRPYVKGNKTDRADVKGILEAYRNQDIHGVPVKNLMQQQLTTLHRVRASWMKTRIARSNRVRGLLRELGLTIPLGADRVVGQVREVLEDADTGVPLSIREVLSVSCEEIVELNRRIGNLEKQLQALARQTPEVERLRTIPGIGVLTATALVGFVGDVQRLRTCRHFASYLGLTPRERSSGLRRRLGAISKRGDTYLRTLLIHGARAVLRVAKLKTAPDRLHHWGLQIQDRRGHNKAAVAVANKMARAVWAVWKRGTVYSAPSRAA